MEGLILIGALVAAGIFVIGIRIIRPTHRMVVETLGKYSRTDQAGFHWIWPVIQRGISVNITERMVDVMPQTVITQDNLNAIVDAVVYYQIRDAKASLYNVDDHELQLTSLARTTLRAVIGQMSFTHANENRDDINQKVETILDKETASYGVEVLRVEIQKIEAPQDVQQAMNEVVKAERKKLAATDLANAEEIKADGDKRAEIKRAEGVKQARILEAEGIAEAIQLENEAADRYFVGNAQILKKLESTVEALQYNAKIVVPSDKQLVNVIGSMADVAPIPLPPTDSMSTSESAGPSVSGSFSPRQS